MQKMEVVWLALNAMDVGLTIVLIDLGGIEFNPLLASLAGTPVALVGFKMVLTVITLPLLRLWGRSWLLKPLSLGMGVVVVWNVIALKLV